MWPTDYGDLGCTAILYKDNIPVAKILDSFEETDLRYVYGDSDTELTEELLKKSFKSLLLDNFDSYLNLPKIDGCSKLLQEVVDTVCSSDSAMCHIDYDDWKENYSDEYTTKDLEKLKEEIKKYNLETVLEVDNGEYQILGYGNLQFCFNDTREFNKVTDMSINEFFNNLKDWNIEETTGYKPVTTFYKDFSIADQFGTNAINDTYNRVFDEWKNNYKFLTELVLVLNWKIYEHYEDNKEYAKLYNELYEQANDYAIYNLKDNESDYFYEMSN